MMLGFARGYLTAIAVAFVAIVIFGAAGALLCVALFAGCLTQALRRL